MQAPEQKAKLEKVISRESTNFQWVKLSMNYGMLAFMVLTKLMRGPGGGKESMFGLKICDALAWVAYAALWVFAALLTLLAARVAKMENQEKLACGYKFTKGDQNLNFRGIMKLVLVAFFAAFFATMSGLSPGLIFNSFLIQLDIHPAVASATGMYMTMFTTAAATINLLLSNGLNIPYTVLISAISIVGTVPGLYGQVAIVVKSGGRNQFTVMILLLFLVICLISVLPLSILETLNANANGVNVTGFNSFCS